MATYYDRAYINAHTTFEALDPEDHRVIPQSGVQQYIFPDDDPHNAIWDYYVTPDKRHLFSLCAEGDFSESFSLCEYFPETNSVQIIFKFDDTITHYPKAIKGSKIHTSLCSMPDGRVIFQNHTTAAAAHHPIWMPYAYRNHMWEGFPGSNIMIWDPKTNKIEDLGIPVRYESLYGGVYSARANAFFSVTLMNGHVYRFDLKDRRVTDYGNLTESSCCCIKVGPDEHIYFASDNGDFMRINIDTLEYEDLGIKLLMAPNMTQNNLRMMYGVNGPDGKLYIGARWCELLQAYNPVTKQIEPIGSVMPDDLKKYPHVGMIYGFDFDEDGTLWYGLMTHPSAESKYPRSEISFFLCSWDFLHGGKPINYGLMGTEKRRVLVFSEAHITDGKFIGADTNHFYDPVSMFCVDLKKLKEDYAAGVKGPLTKDAYHYTRYENGADIYPGDLGRDAAPLYQKIDSEYERTKKYNDMYREVSFSAFSEAYITKPWRILGYEKASVRELIANDDGTCTVICGNGPYTRLVLKKGELLSREDDYAWTPKALPNDMNGLRLPASAGRRWLANITAAVTLSDGRCLVGTEGGLCGIVSGNSVYSLGEVGVFGPVHDLTVTADGKKAYGVAGADEDIGMLFSYDDVNGLVQLGSVSAHDPRPLIGETGFLVHPVAVAVSGDGKRLYVGSDDVKSCVIEMFLK